MANDWVSQRLQGVQGLVGGSAQTKAEKTPKIQKFFVRKSFVVRIVCAFIPALVGQPQV